jgi:hypothetical protein
VVIGGVAAILHGVPRMTGDIDLLIEASLDNARRMLAVLKELGYDTSEFVTPAELLSVKLLMFENGIKIDVMMQIPGLDFSTAWNNKEIHCVDEQAFYLVSKADLIASKLAAGRQKDQEDVKALTQT